MRPQNRRRTRILEVGVLMLISELISMGYGAIPPVTLATIVGQALLYVGIIDVPWDKWDVCLSANKVLNKNDYKCLVLSTVEHADDMHLYYNMISFLVKGRTLEYQYGSCNFGFLLAILSAMTSSLYVALAFGVSAVTGNQIYMDSCAIGFSGVIFAIKFITCYEDSKGYKIIQGFRVPTRYATWIELIAIHILVPKASFMGHFAGVLSGVLYAKTYIGTFIDAILCQLTGKKIVHCPPAKSRSNSERRGYRFDQYSFGIPRFNIFSGFFGRPMRGYPTYYG